jgi:hypothetical protein
VPWADCGLGAAIMPAAYAAAQRLADVLVDALKH